MFVALPLLQNQEGGPESRLAAEMAIVVCWCWPVGATGVLRGERGGVGCKGSAGQARVGVRVRCFSTVWDQKKKKKKKTDNPLIQKVEPDRQK